MAPIKYISSMAEYRSRYKFPSSKAWDVSGGCSVPHLSVSRTALAALALLGGALLPANASNPGLPGYSDPTVTSLAPAPNGGFWVQKQDDQVCTPNCAPTPPGHTFVHNGAPVYQDIYHAGSIAWAPGTNGYWVVTQRGHIYSRGGAPVLCNHELSSCSGFSPNPLSVITAVAAAPNGRGLWAVGRDGKVWTAGEASSYGDAQNSGGAATGIAAAPDGKGYCISISDGGVYCRGEEDLFRGSMPDAGHTITGIAFYIDANEDVQGYWLLAKDGGVFSFNAPFWGSSGGTQSFVLNLTSFPQPGQDNDNPQTAGYAFVNGNGDITVFRPNAAPQVIAAAP